MNSEKTSPLMSLLYAAVVASLPVIPSCGSEGDDDAVLVECFGEEGGEDDTCSTLIQERNALHGQYAILYTDSGYRGRRWYMHGMVSNFRNLWSTDGRRHANDVVSSLRLFNGASISLWMDNTFRGDCRSYRHDTPSLHRGVDGRLGDNSSSGEIPYDPACPVATP